MTGLTIPSRAAALLILALPAGAAAQQTDLAIVYRLMLDEEMILAPANAAQRAAVLGDRLNDQDVVVTSPNTRAAIRFSDDGSLLRVNPGTTIQIRGEGERSQLVKTVELEFGELWGRVTRGEAERLRVQTPAGVAAVKGTEFVIRVAEDGTTTLITLEGVVEFFNTGGTVDVEGGNVVTVPNMDQQPEPRRLEAEDLETVNELIRDESGEVEADRVEVEIQLQDEEGRVRTLIMELPRSQARAILGGGR